MEFKLAIFNSDFWDRQIQAEILSCNEKTKEYGLALTKKQAAELVKTRNYALDNSGRIEFGGSIIDKIIIAFCDSAYIYKDNYEQTLHELIEMFYYYKNETMDKISDDELICFMKNYFNGICQGSLDLLFSRELEKMSRNIKCGTDNIKKEVNCEDADCQYDYYDDNNNYCDENLGNTNFLDDEELK